MIIPVAEFDYDLITKYQVLKLSVGNNGSKSKRKYLNCVCAFDIETTGLEEIEQSIMYVWQFQIETEFTVIGRTWDEFINFLQEIKKRLYNTWLIVYVHNLSYEFQYLAGIYEFQEDEVFCLDSRKILKCDMFGCFEFRCSYQQSNMSLAEFTKRYNVEHQKIDGELFDYSKMRYPWTELNDIELEYITNDVLGLVEAIKAEMQIDGDNLYSIPLTSTGYVRREAKKVMHTYSRLALKKQLPDEHLFKLLHDAFRGGNTHANRYYTGLICENVTGYDIVSSYPTQQVNRRFPMGEWCEEKIDDLDYILKLIELRHHACLMVCSFSGIRLKNNLWGAPYIPLAKCRKPYNFTNDNGRILNADYLEITLTEIDLQIILSEYEFDNIDFIEFWHTRTGKLPQQLTDLTIKWFKGKTELKGIAGQDTYYMKMKNKLNSIYGMSVQNPAKPSFKYQNGEFNLEDKTTKELLEASNKRAFQAYSWGVYITAHARMQLEEGLRMIEPGDFLYSDTDSIKCLGDYSKSFYKFNQNMKRLSESNNAVAIDRKGRTHYLGLFEKDGEYSKFCTLGAKKYVYEDDSGLHCTIAGVNKKLGAEELEEAGGITAFKEGFIFKKAGGLESIYNDRPEITCYNAEGREIKITRNIYLKPSTYTLGLTGEYKRLIEDLQYWRFYDYDLFE